MTRIVALLGALVLLVIVAIVAVRIWGPTTRSTSVIDPDVTVECSSAVEASACGAWGESILSEGSPTTTFEAEDVVRLRLDRALLGLGDTCRAEWFLGRYPDDVAWSEEVACPDG